MSAKPTYHELEQRIRHLEKSLSDIQRDVEKQGDTNNLLESIRKAQSLYLIDAEPAEIYSSLLESLVTITGSEYGFLDEVLLDESGSVFKKSLAISDISWDQKSRELYRQLQDQNMKFEYLDNLAGLPALTGKTIVSNEPHGDPRSKGVPDGHPPINSFMGMPLYFGGQLVCVAGVANRVNGYSEDLAGFLEPLLSTCASITYALRKEANEKENEARLKESELKYKAIAQNFPNGAVVLFDHDLRYLVADGVGLEDVGLDRKNMIGKTIWEVFPQQTCDIIAPDYRAALEGKHTSSEVPFANRTYQTRTLPVYNDDGEVEYGMVMTQDITEQVRDEADLRESRKNLKSFLDAIPESAFLMTVDGTVLELNETTAKRIHKKPEEIKGNNIYDFIPKKVGQDRKKQVDQVIERGEFLNFEDQRDGRYFYHNLNPVFNSNGKVDRIAVVGVDITERKNIEIQLQASEDKYRALYENAPLSYQSLDIHGRILDVSPSWLKTLGYEREEVVGKSFSTLLHADWKKDFQNNFSEFRKLGRRDDVEFKIRHKDGHYLYVSLQGRVGHWPDGRFRQSYCVFQDITEQKAVQDELKQALFTRSILLDSIPNCIALILNKGTREIVASNRKAREIGAVPGKTCFQTCSLRDDPCPWCMAPKMIETNEPQRTEIEYRGKWYEGIWAPHAGDHYVHYIFDITERKQAELDIRRSQERFKLVTETINDVFWMSTLGVGKMVYVSPGYESIWEKPVEEVYRNPKSFMQSIHSEDLDSYLRQVKECHKSGKPYECKYRIICKNDRIKWIHERGYPLHESLEGQQLMTGVCTDITVQSRAHEDLQISTRKLEEKNIALNVLLENREEQKIEFEKTIINNFQRLVFPYFAKLKNCQSRNDMRTITEILELNLYECIDVLEGGVPANYRDFTPMEIQVADLIKAGKTSKEIAAILNVSVRTVFFHRENIRKKLHIHNRKANLRSVLSFQKI